MRLDEGLRDTSCCIKREGDRTAAEQQDFGRQEQPHADLAGIELLLHGGEVMLMVRVVRDACSPCAVA